MVDNAIWSVLNHDDVIKWKHFPRYWPFVRGIHRSPVTSPHKGQWRGTLMFSLICACINGWINNRKAGDLKRHRAHYDVIVMTEISTQWEQRNCCMFPMGAITLGWRWIDDSASDRFRWILSKWPRFCPLCSLQWRHNRHDGVSNHQPHDCLIKRLFGRRSKE